MKDLLVLIAQAHGENTAGKRSPDGKFREYKWSREISKMIVERLYSLGIKTIIINPEEEEVKLPEQVKRANNFYNQYKNEYKNIILISPHVNAAPVPGWSNANGWTVFISNNASTKSKKLAKIMSNYAYNEYKIKGNRWTPYDNYFTAGYYILKKTKTPAILSENMFMTNKDDVDFLNSDKGKNIIVDIHVKSLLDFIQIYNNQ